MIPDIGLMIGAYILMRCCTVLENQQTKTPSKMMSWVTVAVVLLCVFDLLMSGAQKI